MHFPELSFVVFQGHLWSWLGSNDLLFCQKFDRFCGRLLALKELQLGKCTSFVASFIGLDFSKHLFCHVS